MKISKKLKSEIEEYCKLNNIKDVEKFISKNIEVGFNIEKYGNSPFVQEIVVEKEVPVETIKEIVIEKEIPVEVIKEVVKEVPVEKEVIKEIIVEKEVYISDDEKITDLVAQIESLKGKLIEDTQKYIDVKNKVKIKEQEYNIKNSEWMQKNSEVKKLEKSIKIKNTEIKKLKDKIVELEKENTNLKNNGSSEKGRPFRDIYDEEWNRGGHWGSNLKDKK